MEAEDAKEEREEKENGEGRRETEKQRATDVVTELQHTRRQGGIGAWTSFSCKVGDYSPRAERMQA